MTTILDMKKRVPICSGDDCGKPLNLLNGVWYCTDCDMIEPAERAERD